MYHNWNIGLQASSTFRVFCDVQITAIAYESNMIFLLTIGSVHVPFPACACLYKRSLKCSAIDIRSVAMWINEKKRHF